MEGLKWNDRVRLCLQDVTLAIAGKWVLGKSNSLSEVL